MKYMYIVYQRYKSCCFPTSFEYHRVYSSLNKAKQWKDKKEFTYKIEKTPWNEDFANKIDLPERVFPEILSVKELHKELFGE